MLAQRCKNMVSGHRPQCWLTSWQNMPMSIEERGIDERFIHIRREKRVEKLVRLIVTVATISLLMLPTTLLYLLPSPHIVKMIIVVVFTLLFSSAISVLTKAYVDEIFDLQSATRRLMSVFAYRKRHEMFAASAA